MTGKAGNLVGRCAGLVGRCAGNDHALGGEPAADRGAAPNGRALSRAPGLVSAPTSTRSFCKAERELAWPRPQVDDGRLRAVAHERSVGARLT